MPLPGKQSVRAARAWYARNEHRISVVSFVGGFAVDALTLTRADRPGENIFVGARILCAALCIVLLQRREGAAAHAGGGTLDRTPEEAHFWLVLILQFLFGGLLSTFLIFYFRSAALAASWPFFAIVGAAAIANETHKKHYARIGFQTAFLFLSIYLFAIYFLPVVFGRIGPGMFALSGAAAVLTLGAFFGAVRVLAPGRFHEGRRAAIRAAIGVAVFVNGCYLLGLIPPLPLSLQDAGIYHSVKRTSAGDYAAEAEPSGLLWPAAAFLGAYPPYHALSGEPAYAYSAIFSPISFRTTIVHEWQMYNQTERRWKTKARIPLAVSGGRSAGYRTYSIYTGLAPGRWRVNVKTPGGQTIGRMTFRAKTGTAPRLETRIKD